jgi:hypothetical protein
MSNRITNTIGLRAEMEKKHIGLNSFGSYVLSSFDAAAFDRVQKTDFPKLQFSHEDYVVVARGTKGSLAKLAKVTSDRKFARYFGNKFISVELIEGVVFSKIEFIRSIAQNDTLHAVQVSTARGFWGILHGDQKAQYKSLVYPVPAQVPNDFCILDLEEAPPPQSLNMKVRIVPPTNPPEGAAAKAALLKLFP